MFIWSYGFKSELVTRSVHRTRRVIHTTRCVWCLERLIFAENFTLTSFGFWFSLVLFICAEKMKRGQRSQQDPWEQGEFAWYNFPEVVSPRVLAEWRNKLEKLKVREFYIADEVNWEWLEQFGLVNVMNPYSTKIFIGDEVWITCTGWRRLFQLKEQVYKELCLEFYDIVWFRGGDDVFNMKSLTICLGGEWKEHSVVELAWRLDIYNRSEAMTEAFGVFLDNCHTKFPEGINTNWWMNIANGVHIPLVSQEGDIGSPIHRLIHRIIASTINMRKDDDKVLKLDLFFLWSILTLGIFCNIPHSLANFLAERGIKDRNESSICGGMLVTKLARLYGLFERGGGSFLTMMHTCPLILFFRNGQALWRILICRG